MSATSALLVAALTGQSVAPEGKKTPSGPEGLFSMLLGESGLIPTTVATLPNTPGAGLPPTNSIALDPQQLIETQSPPTETKSAINPLLQPLVPDESTLNTVAALAETAGTVLAVAAGPQTGVAIKIATGILANAVSGEANVATETTQVQPTQTTQVQPPQVPAQLTQTAQQTVLSTIAALTSPNTANSSLPRTLSAYAPAEIAGIGQLSPSPQPANSLNPVGTPTLHSTEAAQAMNALISGESNSKPSPQIQMAPAIGEKPVSARPAPSGKPAANLASQSSGKKPTVGAAMRQANSSLFSALISQQVSTGSHATGDQLQNAIEVLTGQATTSIETQGVTPNLKVVLPQHASPVSALAVQIASRAMEGMRRFEIRMDPPELGRIDVQLKIDDQGNVAARLIVERPETLDLLQRDAKALERALSDAGLKTEDGGVRMSLKDGGGNQQASSGFGQDDSEDTSAASNDNNADTMNDTEPDDIMNAANLMINGALNIVV